MVEEVSRLLSQARGAYQREQYQVALAYFQQACQVDSHSPEALLGLGEVSSFLGFHDQAINAFLSLADLYLRAAMFEVAAEVIERILDLEPDNAVALRFQRFIQPRLQPSPTDQTTAVTAIERPTPAPELFKGVKTDELLRRTRAQRSGSPSLSSELDDAATPPPTTTEIALAQTELGPRAPSRVARLPSTASGDEDEDGSEVRTKTFDGDFSRATEKSPKPATLADLGDDEDDDLVSYTDLDPEADDPGGIFKHPLAAQPPTIETAIEIPKARDTQSDTATTTEAAAATDPAPAPRPMFDDVETQTAPEEMLEALARAGRDPEADTFDGAAAPDTDVKPPVVVAASGTGSYPPIDNWEANTEAAVVAENYRKRPAISIDADELDLSDFPMLEEADKQEGPFTSTIALEHKDAVMMLEELAPVSPFITQLSPEKRLALIQKGALLQCFAGQVICREGDNGRALYLLLSGQAAVERTPGGSGSPQRIASLSPGAFFGEGSVLADAPRSTTVRIIEDSLLVEIERPALQELVKQQPQLLTVLTRFLRARLVSSMMMSSPLFAGLDGEERAALAPLLHLHKLNPGQQVVRRGQLLTGHCTVMAGELERFDLADGTGRQVYGPLRVGDSFGTDALHNRPSRLSVGAVTGCWLMRLPTENLRELINQHPELLEPLTAADLLA